MGFNIGRFGFLDCHLVMCFNVGKFGFLGFHLVVVSMGETCSELVSHWSMVGEFIAC